MELSCLLLALMRSQTALVADNLFYVNLQFEVNEFQELSVFPLPTRSVPEAGIVRIIDTDLKKFFVLCQ